MEVITIEDWHDFEKKMTSSFDAYNAELDSSSIHKPSLLFRGHADFKWHPESTLTRALIKVSSNDTWMPVRSYYNILWRAKPLLENHLGYKIEMKNADLLGDDKEAFFASYEIMVLTRHHGFPSPLLDWTRSPYIALFFALYEENDAPDCSIFEWRRPQNNFDLDTLCDPKIIGFNENVFSHDRHHRQQCEYTICLSNNGKLIYPEYSNCLSEYPIKKYKISRKLRNKFLERLDFMNINSYTLYNNLESLMQKFYFKNVELPLNKHFEYCYGGAGGSPYPPIFGA